MARIRSVHPGLFTDEAFMSASPLARLLMIGLWTEAWDDGVFEWKPIVIKARIFPADACDVSALLAELIELQVIKRVERGGKAWGMIRNFRKFQRPKKPNSSGIATADDVPFLGPEHVGSEPVPNQFRTDTEIPPQMEDGGWRREEGKEESESERASAPHPPALLPDDFKPDEAIALAQGVPTYKIASVFAKFTAHARSKRLKSADWQASWLKWCIDEAERREWRPLDAPAAEMARDGPAGVYITPETDLEAWEAWRSHRQGKSLPQDTRGGWFVPAKFPPIEQRTH